GRWRHPCPGVPISTLGFPPTTYGQRRAGTLVTCCASRSTPKLILRISPGEDSCLSRNGSALWPLERSQLALKVLLRKGTDTATPTRSTLIVKTTETSGTKLSTKLKKSGTTIASTIVSCTSGIASTTITCRRGWQRKTACLLDSSVN